MLISSSLKFSPLSFHAFLASLTDFFGFPYCFFNISNRPWCFSLSRFAWKRPLISVRLNSVIFLLTLARRADIFLNPLSKLSIRQNRWLKSNKSDHVCQTSSLRLCETTMQYYVILYGYSHGHASGHLTGGYVMGLRNRIFNHKVTGKRESDKLVISRAACVLGRFLKEYLT